MTRMLALLALLFPLFLSAETLQKAVALSDGERMEFPDKGFSIIPPKGWEVRVNLPGISFFTQIPYSEDLPYQRSIQVLTFNGPMYIDEISLKEFGPTILEKFARASPFYKNYELRNDVMIDLIGARGMLFYTEFKMNDKDMMQAHIITSSKTRHYVLTYTDIAAHFKEQHDGSQFLESAWQSMTSIKLDSEVDARLSFDVILIWAMPPLLIMLYLCLRWFRNRRAHKIYAQFVEGSHNQSLESHVTSQSELTSSESVSISTDNSGKSN